MRSWFLWQDNRGTELRIRGSHAARDLSEISRILINEMGPNARGNLGIVRNYASRSKIDEELFHSLFVPLFDGCLPKNVATKTINNCLREYLRQLFYYLQAVFLHKIIFVFFIGKFTILFHHLFELNGYLFSLLIYLIIFKSILVDDKLIKVVKFLRWIQKHFMRTACV